MVELHVANVVVAGSNPVSRSKKLGKNRRRTQVAKGEVCKTFIQRFESARRLHSSHCIWTLLFKMSLISYKLMQQGIFNFIKEGPSVEKIQMLEEKITKVIDKLKFLTNENSLLSEKMSMLQAELDKKNKELIVAKEELRGIDTLRSDIDRLNTERESVKSQVENLIKELESVEI